MDNQFYGQPDKQFNFTNPKRSSGMETAALVLGIISISISCCLYISIVCGVLSIVFALLSRGGEMTLSGRAKAGLILGIIGLAVTIIFYGFSFYTAIQTYGSFENMMRSFCDLYGYDYDMLFGTYEIIL